MIQGVKNLIILIGIIFLVSCASARRAQELQLGKMNFDAGYYRQAFQELLPLASEGHKEAEYAVGYMYYNGYGVSQDTETGLFWIKKSAEHHYDTAIQALALLRKNAS